MLIARFLRFALALLVTLIVVLCALAVFVWQDLTKPLKLPSERVELRVAPGASVRTIARQIQDAGVDMRAEGFIVAARVSGVATTLRAGRYAIEQGMSMQQVLARLKRGDVLRERVTIVEGWTFLDMRRALAMHPELRHDTAELDDAAIMRKISAAESHPEGQFAPDTYVFDAGGSDLDVMRSAYRAQQARLDAAWQTRATDLPYRTPYEALIMASIVEKETGQASERRRIAGVFVNRQRRGMLLQTDPTVIYGLGERFDGNLRRRDLLADGPYNTYMRAGLPPTPIALPGKAAIAAALDPEPTRALYFVARGDGTSHFSEALSEHNRAVDRFQRGIVEQR